jgi:hypothetical protein
MIPCPLVKEGAEAAAENNNSHYIEVPSALIDDNEDWGCYDHRNAKGQVKIAEFLAPQIKEIMGW